ncbi:microtubule-associated protein futsch-like isoform X4 [Penaeus chinensis]|uniref:microtubule-associated protein futsch-like isoform X4 n=1 Tax=Penaeus chinensis TaxID=139456 RepID=UPI001FB70C5A|nr:microtubule-associated protein futsch-like isoform X4 [Penaeus chinensis]
MNSRGHPQYQPFPKLEEPWPYYSPESRRVLSPPPKPRFPYSVPVGGHAQMGYVPAPVARHAPTGYRGYSSSPAPSPYSRAHDYPAAERHARISVPRHYPDEDVDSDPVVYNAGFTFRMGKESTVHKHLEVQPAHAISDTQSSSLSRQINQFLQKSDHALDRFAKVVQSRSGSRAKSRTPGVRDDSPDRSLALSYRSQRSTSAASIAVKAEKHLETLGRIGSGRKAAPIAEREEDDDLGSSSSEDSFDEFDTEHDVPRSTDVFDISDDTSADLSKLDDLSSDSDDEYFDVVAISALRQQPPPPQSPAKPPPQQPPQAPFLPPTHSQSLPAVNKGIRPMGNAQAQQHAPAAKPSPGSVAKNVEASRLAPSAGATDKNKDLKSQATATPVNSPNQQAQKAPAAIGNGTLPKKILQEQQQVPSAPKKYPAPKPPSATQNANEPLQPNRTDPAHGDSTSPPAKSECQASEKAVPEKKPVPLPSDQVNQPQNIGDGKKATRAPSFKKYPAPKPPTTVPDKETVKPEVVDSAPQPAISPEDKTLPVSDLAVLDNKTTGTVTRETKQETKLHAEAESGVASVKKQQTIDTTKDNTTPDSKHKTTEKETKQSTTNQINPQTDTSRKVRAGSPIPDKAVVLGIKSPAVVTGKLQITPSDGVSQSEKTKGALVASNKVEPKPTEQISDGSKAETNKLINKNDCVSGKETVHQDLNTAVQKENVESVDQPKMTNGILIESQKQEEVTQKANKAQPVGHSKEDKKSSNDDPAAKIENFLDSEISEMEVFSERSSRCSSVASDLSRAVSPDYSQKSGRRSRSDKLASIMNKWESEEVSQVSQKSNRVKTPKIGRLTGLANKFEAGKDTGSAKNELADNKNNILSKLKNPYSPPFNPEPRPPDPVPKKNIGGINTSKFGSVASFTRKPGDPKKESERKRLIGKDTTTKLKDEATENVINKEKTLAKDGGTEKGKEQVNQKDSSGAAENKDLKDAQEKVKGNQVEVIPNGDIHSVDSNVSVSESEAKVSKKKKKKKVVDAEKSVEADVANVLQDKSLDDSKDKTDLVKVNKENSSDAVIEKAGVKKETAESGTKDLIVNSIPVNEKENITSKTVDGTDKTDIPSEKAMKTKAVNEITKAAESKNISSKEGESKDLKNKTKDSTDTQEKPITEPPSKATDEKAGIKAKQNKAEDTTLAKEKVDNSTGAKTTSLESKEKTNVKVKENETFSSKVIDGKPKGDDITDKEKEAIVKTKPVDTKDIKVTTENITISSKVTDKTPKGDDITDKEQEAIVKTKPVDTKDIKVTTENITIPSKVTDKTPKGDDITDKEKEAIVKTKPVDTKDIKVTTENITISSKVTDKTPKGDDITDKEKEAIVKTKPVDTKDIKVTTEKISDAKIGENKEVKEKIDASEKVAKLRLKARLKMNKMKDMEVKTEETKDTKGKTSESNDIKAKTGESTNDTIVKEDLIKDQKIKTDKASDIRVNADETKDTKVVIEDTILKMDGTEDAKREDLKVKIDKSKDGVTDTKKKTDKTEDSEGKADEVEDAKVKTDKREDTKVKTDKIEDAKVKTVKVQDSKVKTEKVEDVAVKEDKVVDAKVKTDKREDTKVKTDKIEDAKVKAVKVQDSKVKMDKVDDAAVKRDKVEDAKIKADKIVDAKVVTNKEEDTKAEINKVADTKVQVDKMEEAKIKSDESMAIKGKVDEVQDVKLKQDVITDAGTSLTEKKKVRIRTPSMDSQKELSVGKIEDLIAGGIKDSNKVLEVSDTKPKVDETSSTPVTLKEVKDVESKADIKAVEIVPETPKTPEETGCRPKVFKLPELMKEENQGIDVNQAIMQKLTRKHHEESRHEEKKGKRSVALRGAVMGAVNKTKLAFGIGTKTLGESVPVQPSIPQPSVVPKPEESMDDKINIKILGKPVPELESEVEALIREASALLGPDSMSPQPSTSAASAPSSPLKDIERPIPLSEKIELHVEKNHTTCIGEEGEEEVYVDAIDPSQLHSLSSNAVDPTQLDILMPLPDVQAERERRSRSRTPMDRSERSCTPSPVVAQTEALLSETDRLLKRSRSNKSLRRSYSRSLSAAALHKLSEVAADLSEEHTTAHLAGERLEAEQAERMKLEKELDRLQTDVRRMTTENGKLEMEKLALRTEVLSAADLNGDADDDDYGEEASLYKRKYEWCLREIEVLKKQLKQQQEDDYDQLVLMKKQLEKKVADAYEETDEQRQVVAQMKRKCQRLQAEMNDLKILLEEQTSRNNLLEKKQRKFDQEMMAVQEELRGERSNKEKIQRERDQILSQKYSFEQEVSTLKLELELKEEKVASLNREIEDLNFTGKTEEEIATLKKAKHDLEMRIKDQEEELDDLAGQVQMLEGAKVRLEMSIEQMRKENRREMAQREEELEEVRIAAQKKVKALEAQLENEHEERTLLVREKHELERRIADLQDRTITHVDEDYVHKLKKELKKTKVLLRDTQTMLEKAQSEGSHKVLVRQLKTQLEDAEFAKTAAIKARQSAESDLSEINSQLEEALRYKNESEDKCARMCKEKAELQTQLEESEEEVAEVMKKYKAVVSQLSVDQITLSEQSQQIAELEHSKQVLQERMLELTSKVEVLEGETANIHTQRRLEMKIKEVESKLELEQTTRQRLESQIGRLKDQIERLSSECDAARLKESQAQDQSKRLGRQLREAKEDLSTLQQRHTDAVNKKNELEKQLELSDSEVITLKSDLKLAFKRIEDLQQAIQGDISDSDSDLSDSDSDSDGSLSSYLTASLRQQRSSSNSTLRTPPSEVQQLDRLELPNSPCSEAMSAISEDLEDASNKESFA